MVVFILILSCGVMITSREKWLDSAVSQWRIRVRLVVCACAVRVLFGWRYASTTVSSSPHPLLASSPNISQNLNTADLSISPRIQYCATHSVTHPLTLWLTHTAHSFAEGKGRSNSDRTRSRRGTFSRGVCLLFHAAFAVVWWFALVWLFPPSAPCVWPLTHSLARPPRGCCLLLPAIRAHTRVSRCVRVVQHACVLDQEFRERSYAHVGLGVRFVIVVWYCLALCLSGIAAFLIRRRSSIVAVGGISTRACVFVCVSSIDVVFDW